MPLCWDFIHNLSFEGKCHGRLPEGRKKFVVKSGAVTEPVALPVESGAGNYDKIYICQLSGNGGLRLGNSPSAGFNVAAKIMNFEQRELIALHFRKDHPFTRMEGPSDHRTGFHFASERCKEHDNLR